MMLEKGRMVMIMLFGVERHAFPRTVYIIENSRSMAIGLSYYQ